MYKSFIRPLLFCFDPEKAHYISFFLLKIINKIPGVSYLFKKNYQQDNPLLATEVFGLKFKNKVGLAAGFDKNATHFEELSNFGFGFIEIGTLTPKPQAGNPKKRLFRLKKDKAIINRMGFNNHGVEDAVLRLKKNKNVLIGGNIGKNKATSNEDAVLDYVFCFEKLFDFVDYFVVNVSSPNTPNLRALQEKEPLTKILVSLQTHKIQVFNPKPILLKIAPDLSNDQLLDIIEIVKDTKISGVIATNTTLSRDGLQDSNQNQMGGLSGSPLEKRATDVIRFLSEKSNKAFPIIGVGGIHTAEDAIKKLEAGADLIQLYTGFIYEGPSMIKKINNLILKNESTN